ncbi:MULTISPECIES: hypothetical protein [unclassified Francisella]|uniref:hypothetical protein n=1 Tax=unclassified Francisella TaxID=2610885 RepID=UPI002E351241|nr:MULTISPECIES: hypothetical protein [unclassified Francisella]MED7819960.1 hypothetical protein [Francisella sp. 19S2-4]MED7830780.1 hypothetical protein [Francisella sp. 19S2-10]
MNKKILGLCVVLLLVSSCTNVEDGIQDNIDHYKKLTRYSEVQPVKYSKHTNSVAGVDFLVANYPDQVINLNGSNDFDKRYDKLVSFLKNNGYTIMSNEKLPLTATVIAEVNKPMPDLKYIGVLMQQNTRLQQTVYNISYGGNKFKAREFYNDYKQTL